MTPFSWALSPASRILGTALLPGGSLARVLVHVTEGRILEVEREPARALEQAIRRDGGVLVLSSRHVLTPAFVDPHCHGAGGGSAHGSVASIDLMARTLRKHGVGAFLATTVTAPLADLLAAARRAAASVATGAPAADEATETPEVDLARATIVGVHFEGPALSPLRSAGHDQAALTSAAELIRSIDLEPVAWQMVRLVTFAPELDGGLDLVRRLVAAGSVASVGHTDADMEVALAAYGTGARSTTHLFSGMPPLHHRAPGPVGAALAASPFVELICDGIHVDARLLPVIARAIGAERLVIVSDALPLAASRLRHISLPGGSARVVRGRALNPDGSLAGSRLLLDGMVESAVRSGIPLTTVLRAVTENPARLLGLDDRGRLSPGAVADFNVVSFGGHLRRILATAPRQRA